MKAMRHTQYGSPDVLRLVEVEKPAPKADEVLIQVYAASVNAYDWHLLTADIFLVRLNTGLLKPKDGRPGADVAGRVVAVGADVSRFRPGDDVFGDIGSGGFAEYACAKEKQLALKPAGMSFEEAAATPMAALTALQGLRDQGRIRAGQQVLIHGASGGVGTFAVQIAKAFGAEVSAVCSPRNLEQARALGADHVIDYTREDFSRSGRRYDLILAANGSRSIFAYRRAITPQGIYVMAGGSASQIFQALLLGPRLSKRGGQQMGFLTAHVSQKDLEFIAELYAAGKVKPIIDRRFPLQETAEALRYLGTGHARAKIVISVAPSDRP
jgi:NADPH:quinone reductase-like Zn-dependent oxidoreductase